MKPALQLRLGQQLNMTPQLQQAIKLLQLSSQELETQLLEALETNPLLEREDLSGQEQPERLTATDSHETDEADPSAMEVENSERIAADDEGWDSYYPNVTANGLNGRRHNDGADRRTLDIPDHDVEDLEEYLLWQLNLAHASPQDSAIGVAIIDAINDDGYLTETLEEIRLSLAPDHQVELDEIQAMLHRIQRFDPVGVGAATLCECLQIQLAMLCSDTPGLTIAQALVADHLELLARQDVTGLKRRLAVDESSLRVAIDLVRSLEPRPGAKIPTGNIEYVRPDVLVDRRNGHWRAVLYDEFMPRLTINNFYAGMIRGAGKEDASYLRSQLQEARWLIKSLETRNDTLLKVANAIVAHQIDFFERGPEAMKPLVLRQTAEAIDMHESTVSRVTSRKYMLTPRGVFELKYFFSSHVGTNDGGECSATAIQAKIGKLIENEQPKRPLSDSKIATILNENGIDVARRTVAKYREALNIPASSRRKRLI